MEKPLVITMPKSRLEKLHEEFSIALDRMDSNSLKRWGRESAKIFFKVTKRRLNNLLKFLGNMSKFVAKETLGYSIAYFKKQFPTHLQQRKGVYKKFVYQNYLQKKTSLNILIQAIKSNPKKAAPELLLAFIGFLLGSGGLDGDGGLPDLDLKAGMGFHRSVFTHSVLLAATIEATAFSLVKLVELFYVHLPANHDKFWDKLLANQKRLVKAFATGTCAGIAYHLLIDANITADQIKPYADLPFSTSMETHQAIFGGNAVVEIVDLNQRNKEEDK